MTYYWIVTFGVFFLVAIGLIFIAASLDNLLLIIPLDLLWGAVCVSVGKWFLKV